MSELKKEFRDFIRQHEMRYFVREMNIHKAFKVTLEGKGEYWVRFSYGMSPEVLTERDKKTLFTTMAEAKALVEKRRAEKKKKEEKAKADKKKRLEITIDFLKRTRWWDMKTGYGDNAKIKPEYEPLIKEVKDIYEDLPDKAKERAEEAYIDNLTRYIRTGMFYSQGMAFSKEQVVSVKYGNDGSVQIELSNGVKITPASPAVSALIKVVFGESDSWSYTNISYPEGNKDDIRKY